MKRLPIMVIVILLHASLVSATLPGIDWNRTYGASVNNELGERMIATSDGGMIVVSNDCGTGNDSQVWLMKLDSDGEILWENTFGGDGYDWGYGICEAGSDGYYIIGGTESYDNCREVWLTKVNSTGTTLWSETYGTPYNDEGYDIVAMEDGGCVIAGYTDPLGDRKTDEWVLRVDADGDTLWTYSLAYAKDERAYSVHLDASGNIIVTGATGSNSDTRDITVVSLSDEGAENYVKIFNVGNTDFGNKAFPTSDGGMVIAGQTEGIDSGSTDFYQAIAMKLTAAGEQSWITPSGISYWHDYGFDVCEIVDERIVLAGISKNAVSYLSDGYVVEYEKTGEVLDSMAIGDSSSYEWLNDVCLLADGSFAVLGFYDPRDGTGRDVWIVKFNQPVSSTPEVISTLPSHFELADPWPNPFNPTVNIKVEITSPAPLRLTVYNTLGQEVAVLANSTVEAATHTFSFDGRNLGSGVYLVEASVPGEKRQVKKIVLMR